MKSSSPISRTPQTFVYKSVPARTGGGAVDTTNKDILLDVYLPTEQASHARTSPPVPLIWIHTGGFLQGTRKFLPAHFLRACDRLNLALIAPDFRLAPQVSIADVLADVADSVRFTLASGPDGLAARLESGRTALDTSRYILSGSSAGGWASLLVGLALTETTGSTPLPTPLGVISIYPITTVSAARAPYFSKPLKPLPFPYAPHAKIGDLIPSEPLQPHLDVHGTVLTEAPPTVLTSRAPLYNYSRQEGIYPLLVLGKVAIAEEYCTPSLIASQLTASSAPATIPKLVFIAYGDADINVEIDQSQQVIRALQNSGAPVAVGVHIEPGKGHLWDIFDADADLPALWNAVARIL